MHISRDARRVINTLQSVSGSNEQDIHDLWIAERLVYSYFPKILIGHIERFYNPKSKNNPDRMAFYEKPARSQNFGRRRNDDWEHTDEKFEIWGMLGQYVLTDYSQDDLLLIKTVDVSQEDVAYGIRIGREEKVYSIPYAIRIAERHKAEREQRKQEIRGRRELFHSQSVNKDINRRGRLEIASRVADWQNEIENLQLQRRVKRLFGEE